MPQSAVVIADAIKSQEEGMRSLIHRQSLPTLTALPAMSQSTAVVVGCDRSRYVIMEFQ